MNVDKKVLQFLKDNPGATPREIADALGIPLSLVRISLTRLRESGHVVKSSRGGYLVRVSRLIDLKEYGESLNLSRGSVPQTDIERIFESLNEIKKDINELRNRLDKVESEIRIIKLALRHHLQLPNVGNERRVTFEERRKTHHDKLIEELTKRKIMHINEAKSYAKYSIDTYVAKGDVVLVSNYLVLKEFFDELKRKFPIRVSDVKKLSNEEKLLLDAMVRDGLVYLHGGREYRLID